MNGIRIITEPSVRLVGHLVIDDAELDGFLKDEGVENWTTDTDEAAQKIVEVAGRLCYKSYAKPRPGGNKAYLEHILEVGHGSVIEHAVYSFIITGVSRSFSHELVRQRAGASYSQRSQRFCDESEGAFVVPPALRKAAEVWRANQGIPDQYRDLWPQGVCRIFQSWIDDMGRAQEAYRRWVKFFENNEDFGFSSIEDKTLRRKKAREAARSVLPNATETQIFVTLNARAARHFIEIRGDESADAEIRAVAVAMLGRLVEASPHLFGDYEVRDVAGGGKATSTPYRKV